MRFGSRTEGQKSLRWLVKRVGERTLVGTGICRFFRRWNSGRITVLMYHNIVPEGAPRIGDESVHLPVNIFSAQLRDLVRTHEVVPLEELWSEASSTRPRAAITFDDAYAGTLDLGIRELTRLGLPATIFVPPGCLGRKVFWWDRLGSLPGFLDRERSDVLQNLDGDGDKVREKYGSNVGQELPEYARSCTLAELRGASKNPGISIGGHAWSHRNLAVLSDSEVRSELGRCLAWLEEEFSEAMIPWLTYPYGLATPEVGRIAREVGFRHGFLADGGGFDPSDGESHPFALPRVSIPHGLSLDGFRIRATGMKVL